MHIFLNGLGASAGAGLTYLYNVVPRLSALPDVAATVALPANLRPEFQNFPKVEVVDAEVPGSTALRFWFEQRELPKLIRKSRADLLISAGNFALRHSVIPQILLSGNSLYTSRDFDRDLRRRHAYRIWLDTQIRGIFAKKSIAWADCTVGPTEAFAAELRRWTGRRVVAIHHGFNPEFFFGDRTPLPGHVQEKLDSAKNCLRLLFVSHYNYYRNFETLFRAIAILRQRIAGRQVRLFLTCKLRGAENPGNYKTEAAAALVQQLGVRNEIVELGAIPYRFLHQVYRACDIYVTPAYTETFAHPLVEAMASGLPVVASDLAVHREICGEARFFARFSPEDLADQVLRLTADEQLAKKAARHGIERSKAFSWDSHVEELLELGQTLCRS